MMRKDLNPIIFVLNNSGYTIERYLHGKERQVSYLILHFQVRRLTGYVFPSSQEIQRHR